MVFTISPNSPMLVLYYFLFILSGEFQALEEITPKVM